MENFGSTKKEKVVVEDTVLEQITEAVQIVVKQPDTKMASYASYLNKQR